mgnify:CR=1 FL=1
MEIVLMQDILQTTNDKHVIGHNGGGGTSHLSYPEDQKIVVMWGM